jgi:uncharacterized protein (TIGR02996 family)
MHDSPEAAFLRKIAESHDDNTARLVYSDWLEEHGQAARAEFIRVQCELANDHPDPHPGSHSNPAELLPQPAPGLLGWMGF